MSGAKCRKHKWKALLSLGVIAGGLLAFAGCNKCRSPEARADKMAGYISSKLDLNETQEGKLNELKDAILEARSRHHAEKKQALNDIKGWIGQESLNENEIKAWMDTKVESKKKKLDSEFPNIYPKLAAFHASLNAEQRTEAVSYTHLTLPTR